MATLAETSLTEPERQAVDEFVRALERGLGPGLRSVWLYGSAARGAERGEDSDVDLMVITADDPPDDLLIHQLSTRVSIAGGGVVSLAPQAWSERRLHERREIGSFFAQELDRDKVVLHGAS